MISASLRRLLRQLYGFRCGYCHVSEEEVGAELTIDHFQPVTSGGNDAAENLVYACHACNSFKSAIWSLDEKWFLHPIYDDFKEHIQQENGIMTGRTDTGRRHIELLHLNRPQLVLKRQSEQTLQALLADNTDFARRLLLLEQRLRRLEEM